MKTTIKIGDYKPVPGDLMVGSEGKRARNEKISQAKKKR